MFTRKLSVVVVLAAVLAFSSVAVAQRPAARLTKIKNYLALTDQQVTDIEGLLKKHQQTAFPLRQDLRARNQDLKSALDSAEPNPNSVGELVIAQHSLRTRLKALNGKLRQDIMAKLTPEQKQKLEQAPGRRGSRGRRA